MITDRLTQAVGLGCGISARWASGRELCPACGPSGRISIAQANGLGPPEGTRSRGLKGRVNARPV